MKDFEGWGPRMGFCRITDLNRSHWNLIVAMANRWNITQEMPSQKISRVTKLCRSNNQSSLQQSRRRLKRTLVKKLWEYNIKCGSDVYLVIADHMGDDVVRFFTTKFMMDQQLAKAFPPSEISLNRHYPPPKRITSENYPKSEKRSRATEQGEHAMNRETQECYTPNECKPKQAVSQDIRHSSRESDHWAGLRA
ncbi:hypothetical protein ACJ73_03675 [Blastomyces percursus]|uniref:Uncharacterized protein n=1 Tax=Blastomyces percursus TaxID=1658174 RepID=A0A1J9QXK1_9EURO|nr:hypothetical protein ACJ73_03675 [Blastomyces percursus]